MPSIEFPPTGPHAARTAPATPIADHGAPAGTVGAPVSGAAPIAEARSPVVRSDAFDPGKPPVDADRVHEIRRAIETGTYPIVPARVADAMIAAGLLLRSDK